MKKEQINYRASSNEHDIYANIWRPESGESTRGIIQIAHGMQEHSGRYSEFAEFLVRHGYIVCANDHAGHGASHGGLMGHIADSQLGFGSDGYRHMVRDMRRLYELMREREGNLKYILFGHSMGSFLARYYCTEYGALDGLCCSGTGDPGGLMRLALPMCRLLVRLCGPREAGAVFSKISRKIYNRKFSPRRTDFDWLSTDTERVDAFVADELCGFPFTYGAYLDLFELIAAVSAGGWVRRVPKDLPVYLFSGTSDPVGDYGAGVRRVYDRLLAAGCADVELKLYSGGRHEMLNERNRDEVYEDTLKWIERVGEGGSAAPRTD